MVNKTHEGAYVFLLCIFGTVHGAVGSGSSSRLPGVIPQTLNSVDACMHASSSSVSVSTTLDESSWSLDRKIGQLIAIALPNNPGSQRTLDRLGQLHIPSEQCSEQYAVSMIRTYSIGAILYVCEGYGMLQREFTERLQQVSAVPLLIMQDLEPGIERVLDEARLPCQATLGALSKEHEQLIFDVGVVLGNRAKKLGVHVVLAPVADVLGGGVAKSNVVRYRCFSDDPELVARKVALLARGIQQVGVLACAKHFPGHGSTNVDSHTDLPKILATYEQLCVRDLIPFKRVADDGIACMMTAHIMVPSLGDSFPMSLSKKSIELLQACSFSGLVITDALRMKSIADYFNGDDQAAVRALVSGADIVLWPENVPRAIAAIKEAVKQGVLSEEDVMHKARKILVVKNRLGLVNIHQVLPIADEVVLYKKIMDHVVTWVKEYAGTGLYTDIVLAPEVIKLLKAEGVLRSLVPVPDAAAIRVSIFYDLSDQEKEQLCAYIQSVHVVGKKICVVLYRSYWDAKVFKDADGVLVAYETDLYTQEVVARVFAGEHTPCGVYPLH